VTIFYLTTNIVLFGIRPWDLLAGDEAPLATATNAVLSSAPTLALIGGIIVGGGALISVAGSDESGMIGTSRLGYALAADGLFPRVFAKIHPKFKTPYLGIMIQAATALIAAIVGNLTILIATSVFFMAIAYVATSASVFSLHRKSQAGHFHLRGGMLIPSLGIIFSLYLITQCTITQITLGLALLLAGLPIYVKYSPKKEITDLKEKLLSRESMLRLMYSQEDRFLAHVLRHMKRFYRRIAGKKQTWEST
jgi:amino acid transporter